MIGLQPEQYTVDESYKSNIPQHFAQKSLTTFILVDLAETFSIENQFGRLRRIRNHFNFVLTVDGECTACLCYDIFMG